MRVVNHEHSTQPKPRTRPNVFVAPTPVIQKKLEIGEPDDKYEQEADAVADQVMKMPASQIPPIQRKCDACEEEEKLRMKPLAMSVTPVIQKQGEVEEEGRMKPLATSITPIFQKQSDGELQMKSMSTDTIIQKEDEPTSTEPSPPETEAPVSSNNTLPNLTLQLPSPLILRANGVMYTSPTFLVQGPNGSIVDLAPYTGNGLVDFPLAALESLGIPILSYFHFHMGRARQYLGQHFDSAYGLSGGTSFIRNALHYGYITADDVTLFGAPSSYSFEHYSGIPNLNIVANPMDIGTMINVSYFNYPLEEGHNNPAVLFTITAPFNQNPFEAFVNLGGAIGHALSGDLYSLPNVTHSYPRFQNEPNREIGTSTTTTQISPKADSKVSPSAGFESKLITQKGGGRSLPNPTREFMEQRIGADFSQVTIHTDTRATELNKDLGARAFTNANDIYFNQGQYNPQSSEGKHLLAHELTHVVQQNQDSAGANAIQRWQVSAEDNTELPEPPPIGMSVSLSGLKFYVRSGLYFSAGATRPQLMAAILRRLLEGQYRVGLEESVVAHLNANNVEWSGSLASDSTAVAGQVAVGEVTLDSSATLQLLSFLEEARLQPVLNETQRELLNLGSSAEDIYNAIQGSDKPLPAWYTEWMFARVMASNADMLRRYHSTRLLLEDGTSISGREGLIEQIRSYVAETANVLEEIRVDYELGNFIDNLSARDGYRRLVGQSRLETRVFYAPPENLESDVALNFLQYIRTQPSLLAGAQEALNRSARITLLARFDRFYDRAHRAELMTDEHLADSAPTATDAAWRAEMTSHPGLQPPLFEASLAANYRFIMSMKMDHWINHFALYSYQWERARITRPPSENDGEIELIGLPQTPTHGEVRDLERRRVSRYNEADISRVIDAMGTRPSVSALTLVVANNILRSFASELRSDVQRMTESRNEKVMTFPEAGLYMVRCRAVPVLEGDEEVVRLPSVAYLIVNVMDPVDLAATQHTRTMETRTAARARIDEINEILARDMSNPEAASLQEELLLLQDIAGEIDQVFSGRRANIARQLDPLLRQQQELEDRISNLEQSSTPDQRELERARARLYLFRLQYSRAISRLEGQEEEIDEIEESRSEQHQEYEGPREQIDATFVNDSGVTINLVLEATHLNAEEDTEDDSHELRFMVADLTINTGGLGRGRGSNRLIAISNAVVDVLESHGDYGRGHLVITVDGEHLHRPVHAGAGAIFMEALESVTMVASIAAIIASPFTGGTSLYLLLPLGVVGALPSMYRLYQRYDSSTLRPDLEVALDVVNAVGGFIGLGHGITSAFRLVQLGRVMLVAGLAADGTGYLLMGAATVSQLMALRDMPEGERNAQFIEIMFNALVQVGMIAGGSLAQFHAQQQAHQRRRQGRRPAHVDAGDSNTAHVGDADGTVIAGEPSVTPQEAQVGGVRGRNVYDMAVPGERSIFSIIGRGTDGPSVSDIFRLMTESRENPAIRPEFGQIMRGGRLTHDGGSPFFHLELSINVGGNIIQVRVEVTVRARGFDTHGNPGDVPRAGSHGAESGPASFSLEYIPPENGQPGRWRADVEVDPRLRLTSEEGQQHRSAEFDTIVGHELDEIADIVVDNHQHTGEPQGTTFDPDILNQNIAQQAEASMFRPVMPSEAPPITSHDRAAARELMGHHRQIGEAGITPLERARREGRFGRLMESMGFLDTIDMARFNQLMDGLRAAGQADAEFLLRVESQWRYDVSQRSLATANPLELLPGGRRRVVTPEIIGHIIEPGPSNNFETSGISGGHETARLTSVNGDLASPFFVVQEGSMQLPNGETVRRYRQYELRPGNSKLGVTHPTPVAGSPTPAAGAGMGTMPPAVPGTHYDPAQWRPSRVPKSTVDSMQAFLPAAERAFADFFRRQVQGQITTPQNGEWFRHQFEGVTYAGFYNYDGVNAGSLSVNSIFVDAFSIP